jgi:opacity protein-like surface antigen
MKKILLVATSVAALGVAGHAAADHNYVGMGLGWTMAKAKTTSNDTNQFLFPGSVSTKKTATDNGAVSGKLFVGHHFGGDLGWLVEAGFGMDSTKTQAKYNLKPTPLNAAQLGDSMTASLKRKHTLSLGAGFSKAIGGNFNAYMKVSLLLSKFQITGKSSGNGLAAGAETTSSSSTKTKTKLGGGLTIGGSKNITQDLSLGLDYTFEMYQKIKTTSPSVVVGGVLIGDRTTGFSRTMKPCYHTVMLTLARKF